MKIDFDKYSDGLVPAIIQDANTNKVLMLGFMNEAALNKTNEIKINVFIFYSLKSELYARGFNDIKQVVERACNLDGNGWT